MTNDEGMPNAPGEVDAGSERDCEIDLPAGLRF
jgi:hypothetical protein